MRCPEAPRRPSPLRDGCNQQTPSLPRIALAFACGRILSYNQLTGSITSELGALSALGDLYVAQLRIAVVSSSKNTSRPLRPYRDIGVMSQQHLAARLRRLRGRFVVLSCDPPLAVGT